MIDKNRIGNQLKELRKSRGWRQLEVADKVGLSCSAISNIEAGKRALTLTTLKRFCEVYNIDISYFGIETNNFNESVDLVSRLEKVFNNDDISDDKKDKLYRDIMRIYLESREKKVKNSTFKGAIFMFYVFFRNLSLYLFSICNIAYIFINFFITYMICPFVGHFNSITKR